MFGPMSYCAYCGKPIYANSTHFCWQKPQTPQPYPYRPNPYTPSVPAPPTRPEPLTGWRCPNGHSVAPWKDTCPLCLRTTVPLTSTTTINSLPPTAGAGDRDLEGDRERKSIDEG